MKASFGKAYVIHTPAVHVKTQKFYPLAVTGDKAIHRPVCWIAPEVGGDDGGWALDAGAHVTGACGYEKLIGGAKRVHSDTTAFSTVCISASFVPEGTATEAAPKETTIAG